MDTIKQILVDDLNTINKNEKRDGKPYFNSQFLNEKRSVAGQTLVYNTPNSPRL